MTIPGSAKVKSPNLKFQVYFTFHHIKVLAVFFTFYSTEEISRLAGHVVRKEYFDEHGFDSPILVNRIDGLGIRVPPPNFTILDVENYVGM